MGEPSEREHRRCASSCIHAAREARGVAVDRLGATVSERGGKPWSLFSLWFMSNANVTTLATGMLGAALGATFLTSVLAILLGVAVGTVFTAFHSAQGPQLGLPQMIQSRAQFGYRGVILICAIVVFSLVGFNMFNQMLGAEILTMTTGVEANWLWYLVQQRAGRHPRHLRLPLDPLDAEVADPALPDDLRHLHCRWRCSPCRSTPLSSALGGLHLAVVPRPVRRSRGLRTRLGALRLRLLALPPAADQPGQGLCLHLWRRLRRRSLADDLGAFIAAAFTGTAPLEGVRDAPTRSSRAAGGGCSSSPSRASSPSSR